MLRIWNEHSALRRRAAYLLADGVVRAKAVDSSSVLGKRKSQMLVINQYRSTHPRENEDALLREGPSCEVMSVGAQISNVVAYACVGGAYRC